MIDVDEAERIIDAAILNLSSTKVPLEKALGRVLQQTIVADADFPPFDRVMMDGIAVRFDDMKNGIREFKLTGIQAAGDAQKALAGPGTCLEVMTGAVAPAGCDLVVPYEEIEINSESKIATVNNIEYQQGKHIHKQGSDKKKGDVLVNEGCRIDASEIAISASVGLTTLNVTRNPRIAIVSTGEELVDIHEKPLPHQIRRSNVYAIVSELKKLGINADLFHLNDDEHQLFSRLEEILEAHDVLITSGGVSRGKFDHLPEVLEKLGVEKLFHRIKQRPGKPFWFGVKDRSAKVVFAFPGNPVSTFLCYHRYFVPWLKKSLGVSKHLTEKAILAEDLEIKTALTYFLQVKTELNDKGQLMAIPKVGKGSGDHANLLESDAFLELPANTYQFQKGEVFKLIPYRRS